MAEGHFCDDRRVFAVTNMALPPCERAEISKYANVMFILGFKRKYTKLMSVRQDYAVPVLNLLAGATIQFISMCVHQV